MNAKAEVAVEERRKLEAAEAGRRQLYGLVLLKSISIEKAEKADKAVDEQVTEVTDSLASTSVTE
jgi:hypothetical protein